MTSLIDPPRPDGNQVPQPKHVARQVGESYRDWGARLAGQLRAAEREIEERDVTIRANELEIERLRAARAVLADRDAELLELKGPCSGPGCRLHCAHRGPCDIREARTP